MDSIYKIIDPRGVPFIYQSIDHTEYKYKMVHNYSVQLDFAPEEDIRWDYYTFSKRGVLMLYRGYMWDGVSGPMIDTKNTMRPGGIHDAGFRMIRRGHMPVSSKHNWDLAFKNTLKEDWAPKTIFGNMWNCIRAEYAYQGVNLFGASSCRPPNYKKE